MISSPPSDATVPRADAAGCPFREGRLLPTDGTPLAPSTAIAEWRDKAPATPLLYADGHVGWIATRYEVARAVLENPKFSQQPQRVPANTGRLDDHRTPSNTHVGPDSVDQRADDASSVSDLLALDGEQHLKIRRSVAGRFSIRSVRGAEEAVAAIVRTQLAHLMQQECPVDLTSQYAQPISARVHCYMLGIGDQLSARFFQTFVLASTTQNKVDFVRDALDAKRRDLGDDVLSDLLRSELTELEVEGVAFVLMTSGRDSVAYMISTTSVALLTHPDQLTILRDDPSLMAAAVEEFMRMGAMFVTLFPRTATGDIEHDGVVIHAGETVSVSPVGANHDARRWDHPDELDVRRDAFGHLSFGHGPHACVGQQLARVEIRQAIAQLISALPTLYLMEAEQLQSMPFAHPVATYEAGSVIVGW